MNAQATNKTAEKAIQRRIRTRWEPIKKRPSIKLRQEIRSLSKTVKRCSRKRIHKRSILQSRRKYYFQDQCIT